MLARHRDETRHSFACPSHRYGRQIDPGLVTLLGEGAYAHDVTQVDGIDDLLAPRAEIAQAQALAAEFWGARETHFLVNGTSSGIQAALLALVSEGDTVALPRAVHRCAVEGLILSGAVPRWIPCGVDARFGCALPPHPDDVKRVLTDVRLILLTRPTYHGDAAFLTWIQFARECGTMVLVDEAWGAHFGLHADLPTSACRAGADVVVNSTHKTAGALSGGSMLHRVTDRVDAERLASTVRLLTTTSAWYGMLASLDGARRDLVRHGRERFAHALDAARGARKELAAIPGLDVMTARRPADRVAAYDETRLVFSALGRGLCGTAVAEVLRRRHGIHVELADACAVVCQICGEDDARALPALVEALRGLESAPPRTPFIPPWDLVPDVAMTPRQAYLARHVRLPLAQARGRVAAEMICPYPPGMPLVAHGERVTEAVEAVLRALPPSVRLQGCGDPTRATIQVVA